jgi:GTP-binding protein EngB required for normal cell division
LYFHILFNKSDKLNKSDQKKNLNFAMQTFSSVMPEIIKETSHSIFSSTKKRGVEELFSVLKLWLDKADCIHTI